MCRRILQISAPGVRQHHLSLALSEGDANPDFLSRNNLISQGPMRASVTEIAITIAGSDKTRAIHRQAEGMRFPTLPKVKSFQ